MPAEFCDTNVIVYAHVSQDPAKRLTARQLIDRLIIERSGVISVQVMLESYSALRKYVSQPECADIVSDLAQTFAVVEPAKADVLTAVADSARWQISVWDALILVTARNAGASVLWTEDLNPGQDYSGVRARNPFR